MCDHNVLQVDTTPVSSGFDESTGSKAIIALFWEDFGEDVAGIVSTANKASVNFTLFRVLMDKSKVGFDEAHLFAHLAVCCNFKACVVVADEQGRVDVDVFVGFEELLEQPMKEEHFCGCMT